MKLLFRRTQSSGKFGGAVFRLWGKVELDNDEQAIIRRYRLDAAVLIITDQPRLLGRSVLVGILIYIAVATVFATFVNFRAAIVFGLLAGVFAGYYFYHFYRETIFVRDLLHGRSFRCRSVIELARKEEWLATITAFLRQVMESSKHWDGTETRDIEALPKDEARRVIIEGI